MEFHKFPLVPDRDEANVTTIDREEINYNEAQKTKEGFAVHVIRKLISLYMRFGTDAATKSFEDLILWQFETYPILLQNYKLLEEVENKFKSMYKLDTFIRWLNKIVVKCTADDWESKANIYLMLSDFQNLLNILKDVILAKKMSYDSYEKWRELTLEKKKLTVNTLGITFERKKPATEDGMFAELLRAMLLSYPNDTRLKSDIQEFDEFFLIQNFVL